MNALYLDTFWTTMLNTRCERAVPGYFLNNNVEYLVWTRCTWLLFEQQCWIPGMNPLYLATFWTSMLNTWYKHAVPGYFKLKRNVKYPVRTRCTWLLFEPQFCLSSVNTQCLATLNWSAILNTQCEHAVPGYFFEPQFWLPSMNMLYLATLNWSAMSNAQCEQAAPD
jgi:hypothetical protein